MITTSLHDTQEYRVGSLPQEPSHAHRRMRKGTFRPYRQIFLQVRGEYWKRRRIKLVNHIVANLYHDWPGNGLVVVIGTEPGLMVGEPAHPGLGLVLLGQREDEGLTKEVVQEDRNSQQIVDRTEFGKSPKPKLTQPTKKSSLVSSLWRLLFMFMVSSVTFPICTVSGGGGAGDDVDKAVKDTEYNAAMEEKERISKESKPGEDNEDITSTEGVLLDDYSALPSAYFLTDSLKELEICFSLPMPPAYFLKDPLVSQVHVGYAMLDPLQEKLEVCFCLPIPPAHSLTDLLPVVSSVVGPDEGGVIATLPVPILVKAFI